MNTQPEGSGRSRYYYEAAEPPQEYSEEYQTEYSARSNWQTSNYEPEVPQTYYNGGDGPSTYTQQAEIESASSNYSYSSSTRRQEYNTPQPERYACQVCNATFRRPADRTRHFNTVHLDNGERRYRCEVEDCPADVTTWRRWEKLKTHNKTWHSYSCEEPGCVRGYPHGFKTQEDLEAHRQQAHRDPVGLYDDGPVSATSKGKSVFVDEEEEEEDEAGDTAEGRSYMQTTDDSYTPQSTYAVSSRSMYTTSSGSMYDAGYSGAPHGEEVKRSYTSIPAELPQPEVLDSRKWNSHRRLER
jgi:hypothetical protein